MQKENAAKEKEQKETAHALEQIEAKAQRSYQKDKAKFGETRESHELDDQEWQFDDSPGYYYDKTNGFCNDPKSGFYYSDAIGKWVTQEEAYASPQFSSNARISGPNSNSLSTSQSKSVEKKTENKSQNELSPGQVVSSSLNPRKNVKDAYSSLTVGKRKRAEEKSKAKVISEEEKAALKAREAEKSRREGEILVWFIQ
ncbi:hypothetical protein HN873_071258 [Arachis hypogaea]